METPGWKFLTAVDEHNDRAIVGAILASASRDQPHP
jgi:hypothetical protein